MKLYITIYIILTAAQLALSAEYSNEEKKQIANECLQESGASKNDLRAIFDINYIPHTTRQYCLIACYSKRIGKMNNNNKFIIEEVIKELQPIREKYPYAYENLSKSMRVCDTEVVPDANQCTSVEKFVKCVKRKTISMVLGGKK